MKRFGFVLILPLILSACATAPDPRTTEAAQRPLICRTEPECTLYWQRAQFWIASHSTTKLQTVSDTVLETYNQREGSVDLAYQFTRERHSDGTSRIWVYAGCRNSWGCAHHPHEGIAAAKAYIAEQ